MAVADVVYVGVVYVGEVEVSVVVDSMDLDLLRLLGLVNHLGAAIA